MKVTVNKIPEGSPENAVINAVNIDDNISAAVSLLENGERTLVGFKDGDKFLIKEPAVYYAEAVDEKCFVYTKDSCYELKQKLYELEAMLDFRFVRVSKSMVLNIKKIKSVKTAENARMNAALLNGEQVVISRSYVKDLKKRLGL